MSERAAGDFPATVALILAAGAGERLGGLPKCLIQLGGKTLLQRQLESLQPLRLRGVCLVLGHHADAIEQHLDQLAPRLRPFTVRNTQPGHAPADSLHLGLQSLGALPDRLLVLLADLPLLGATDIRQALDAFDRRERGQHALVPTVAGQPGHPVVLSDHACALLRGRGRGGLRAWRAEQPQAVARWDTANEAHVRDLDTPEDLSRLAADTGLPVVLPMPQVQVDNG